MPQKQPYERIYDVARDSLYKILKNRGKAPELPLLSLPSLNKKMWGIRKGRMTLIGARTSHGKSAMALQISIDLAKQGKKILFLSLEMDNNEMTERIYCNTRQVDNYHLLSGRFEESRQEWDVFLEEIDNWSLVFSDMVGKDWKDIDEYLSNMKIRPDVVILDYIQATRGQQRTQKEQFDDYILHFREMAMRYNFAGILCSQVNRASQDGKTKEPELHQLKGTGVLEENSDVVILLYYPHKNDKNESIHKYKIFLEKNRNGRTGYMDLFYYPQYYLFTETEIMCERVQALKNAEQENNGWEE